MRSVALLASLLVGCGAVPNAAAPKAVPKAGAVVGPSEAAAASAALPMGSAASVPQVKGLPFDAPIVHVELDRPAEVAVAACTVHGTDKPSDARCGSGASMILSSDARGAKPLVTVAPESIEASFELRTGAAFARVTVADAGISAVGFVSLAATPFEIDREASAFQGHVRLLANDIVTVSQVDDDAVRVHTTDDTIHLEKVEATTTCDALHFDPYAGGPKVPALPPVTISPAGSALHLKAGPGEQPFFTVTPVDGPLPGVAKMQELRGDAHVIFATKKARFDAWVDRGVGDSPAPQYVVREATDVLVADAPAKRGPPGIRFAPGVRVVATDRGGGWAEVTVYGKIWPAEGLHYFLPWNELAPL